MSADFNLMVSFKEPDTPHPVSQLAAAPMRRLP